jgi:hypothetical protein
MGGRCPWLFGYHRSCELNQGSSGISRLPDPDPERRSLLLRVEYDGPVAILGVTHQPPVSLAQDISVIVGQLGRGRRAAQRQLQRIGAARAGDKLWCWRQRQIGEGGCEIRCLRRAGFRAAADKEYARSGQPGLERWHRAVRLAGSARCRKRVCHLCFRMPPQTLRSTRNLALPKEFGYGRP